MLDSQLPIIAHAHTDLVELVMGTEKLFLDQAERVANQLELTFNLNLVISVGGHGHQSTNANMWQVIQFAHRQHREQFARGKASLGGLACHMQLLEHVHHSINACRLFLDGAQ